MLFFILACLSNFDVSDILPSPSNCKLILSDNIDVAKKSLFSSKGFKESIVLVIFSILSCGLAIVEDIINSHGGNIQLSKSKYDGLQVKISLPF